MYLKDCKVQTEQNARKSKVTKHHPLLPEMKCNSHVCLLLVLKITTCTYQLCKRQSADTNALTGWYRLSAKRPIPIIGASLVE